MTDRCPDASSTYEPPGLVALGSVHELTLTNKTFGTTDGDWFVGNNTVTGLHTVS